MAEKEAEKTPTLLSYKGAVIKITEPGEYQLVDDAPFYSVSSYIYIDSAIEGEVYITLPNSETTYGNNSNDALLYVILDGSSSHTKVIVRVAKVEKPLIPDMINSKIGGEVGVDRDNGTIEVTLYAPKRWKATQF